MSMNHGQRLKLLIFGCLLGPLLTNTALASKVDLDAGVYNFSAKNTRTNTSQSLSGLGSYRLGYRYGFFDHYELDLGYSLLATKTFSGDLSFGVDLGLNFFPFSYTKGIEIKTKSVSSSYQEHWKPFIGISFNQRNFQSISSQYAGAGIQIGIEHPFQNYFLTTKLRYFSLLGPNNSNASQVDWFFGVSFQF